MAEIRFYQVTASEVDRALPRLVEKVYSSGKRILIYCSTPERMKQLDTILWTFTPKVFLPHGTLFDMMPESQPVLLSTNAANTNNAKVVVLDQGQELPAELKVEIAIELVDGNNDVECVLAEERAATYQSQGHSVLWWQQDPTGKWLALQQTA